MGSPDSADIIKGYTFDNESIELGVLVSDGKPVPEANIRISMSMLNRHWSPVRPVPAKPRPCS